MTTINGQMAILAALKAGKAKIENPEHWITGSYAKNADGRDVEPKASDAVCFCSVGALNAGTPVDEAFDRAYLKAYDTLWNLTENGIVHYNDSHTHEEVMAIWDKAIMVAQDDLIIMNLELLLEAVKAQPTEQFDLNYYKKKDSCGTLFCTVGIAATIPEFQQQGYSFSTLACAVNIVTVYGEEVTDSPCVDAAFGTDAYRNLFCTRGASPFDGKFRTVVVDDYPKYLPSHSELSDKELAVNRLETRLAQYKEKRNGT